MKNLKRHNNDWTISPLSYSVYFPRLFYDALRDYNFHQERSKAEMNRDRKPCFFRLKVKEQAKS